MSCERDPRLPAGCRGWILPTRAAPCARGFRKSSADVVIVCCTAVDGTPRAPRSAYRSSWQIRTRLPESFRILTSSRSRSIGLHGTMTAPHFQAASTVMSTCGMFCRYIAMRSPGSMPLPLQRDGQRVRHRVELTGGDRSIEVVHQHGVGSRRCTVARNMSRAVALAGSMVLRVMTVSLLLLHSLHSR